MTTLYGSINYYSQLQTVAVGTAVKQQLAALETVLPTSNALNFAINGKGARAQVVVLRNDMAAVFDFVPAKLFLNCAQITPEAILGTSCIFETALSGVLTALDIDPVLIINSGAVNLTVTANNMQLFFKLGADMQGDTYLAPLVGNITWQLLKSDQFGQTPHMVDVLAVTAPGLLRPTQVSATRALSADWTDLQTPGGYEFYAD